MSQHRRKCSSSRVATHSIRMVKFVVFWRARKEVWSDVLNVAWVPGEPPALVSDSTSSGDADVLTCCWQGDKAAIKPPRLARGFMSPHILKIAGMLSYSSRLCPDEEQKVREWPRGYFGANNLNHRRTGDSLYSTARECSHLQDEFWRAPSSLLLKSAQTGPTRNRGPPSIRNHMTHIVRQMSSL